MNTTAPDSTRRSPRPSAATQHVQRYLDQVAGFTEDDPQATAKALLDFLAEG